METPSQGQSTMTLTDYTVQREAQMAAAEFIDVLNRSTLGQRRPIDQPDRIQAMLDHADLIVAARQGTQLVGVARAITDFSYCTYLSDLAVDENHQRRGIGRALLEETHRLAGHSTMLILLAAPMARDYYPHIGMTPHESCWIRRLDPPQPASIDV